MDVAAVVRPGLVPVGPGRLHFRRYATDPPALVAVFAPPHPAAMPQTIRGTFRAGNPHTLVDCEAASHSGN